MVKREVLEEAGCECEILHELGTVFESRAALNFTQIRYYYIARVIGEKNELQLTEEEFADETTVCWVRLEEALQLIKDSNPTDYVEKFVRLRNIIVLTEAITKVGETE